MAKGAEIDLATRSQAQAEGEGAEEPAGIRRRYQPPMCQVEVIKPKRKPRSESPDEE